MRILSLRNIVVHSYKVAAAVILILLFAPVFVVIPIAFSSSSYLQFPPPGFSVQWFQEYFNSAIWLDATARSLRVAPAASLLAVILGTLASFTLVRHDFPGKNVVFLFLLSPMVVPVIVIAVSVYFLFAKLHLLGTEMALILSHTVITLPIVVLMVSSSLQGVDTDLEKAARNLGANSWRTFLYVTFPLIRPAIISAALIAFITSFDELIIALFVAGVRGITLPKKMWESIRFETDPTNAAVSTLLIALAATVLILMTIISSRRSRSLKN